MENATKALLIAAAVLIAILIISLGLVVYNKASETMDSVDMSGQEIQAFNEKFTKYAGDSVRGTEVNALLKTALNNNITKKQESKTAMMVEVKLGNTTVLSGSGGSETSLSTRADASKMYKVVVNQDGEGGLVHSITISTVGTN